jgi:hypothetical protein
LTYKPAASAEKIFKDEMGMTAVYLNTVGIWYDAKKMVGELA